MKVYVLWEMLLILSLITYFSYFFHRYIKLYTSKRMTSLLDYGITTLASIILLYVRTHLLSYATLYLQIVSISIFLEFLYYFFKRYKIYNILQTSGVLIIVFIIFFDVYNEYQMGIIKQKTYNLTSDKIDSLNILQITDLHMSDDINIEQIRYYCNKMNTLDVDIVVLTGDIFEDKTSYQEMCQVIKALSELNNRWGMYYIFGNHDSYSKKGRDYDEEDIKRTLEDNNITVLQDEIITIKNITIIGRDNIGLRKRENRKSMEHFLDEVPLNNYIIVLDHQPIEYRKNASLGVDLQLSGHTHGGHAYPLEYWETKISNKMVYGIKEIGDFSIITSSGLSFSKRTGAPNEYVYIRING